MYCAVYCGIYCGVYCGVYSGVYCGVYAGMYSGMYCGMYCGMYSWLCFPADTIFWLFLFLAYQVIDYGSIFVYLFSLYIC